MGGYAPPISHSDYNVAAELGANERREIREEGLDPLRERWGSGGVRV